MLSLDESIGLTTAGLVYHTHRVLHKGMEGRPRVRIEDAREDPRRSKVNIEKVLGDCGYTSWKMASLVGSMDGKPFLKVRKNHTARKKGSKKWSLMVRFQKEMPEEFMRSYCYRVVIEGMISAMKNIFGVLVRSRKRHNQDVEVLSRMVLWNYLNIEPEES
ncbi:MAG: hypothetical protein V3U09_06920 [Thermoplasmata archaeon]